MELILISKSKLKIMLDEKDMKEYNIGDETDCARAETRRAIRTILDRAKDQIGFNTEGVEIFVQLYTSKSGGCELFVTKGNDSDNFVSNTAHPSDKRQKKRETGQKKTDIFDDRSDSLPEHADILPKSLESEFGRVAFSFDSLSDIFKVCRLLKSKGFSGRSHALKDMEGKYYLFILGLDMKAYSRLDDMSFIYEYGKKERWDTLFTYLEEHGKVLCFDNAVDVLSAF